MIFESVLNVELQKSVDEVTSYTAHRDQLIIIIIT